MDRQPAIIDLDGLDSLIRLLRRQGYEAIGPRLRDDAIVLAPIESVADLPAGLIDEQQPGRYRLKRRGRALFAHAAGPTAWKRYLHPPRQALWRSRRSGERVEIVPEAPQTRPLALIGVRACDLAAIHIQDRVLQDGAFPDPHYVARRAPALLVAVNCTRTVDTCFCVSMNTGPRASHGFDLALTELAGRGPKFLVETGSDRGERLLAELPSRPATRSEIANADALVEKAGERQHRSLPADRLAERLAAVPEHPRWREVAARCLSCGNCTLVCPTCFCTSVEDGSDLAGVETWRERRWDSCFTADFSFIHGGPVRSDTRSRYRQWLTHKLSSWHEQFGTSGCVGCGRCIVWCPVGIDLTAEAAALMLAPPAAADPGGAAPAATATGGATA